MKKLLTILIILTVVFVSNIPSGVEAQSRNNDPSPEPPRAEQTKDESAGTRKKETKKEKKSRPSPSPTTEQSSTQITSLFKIIVRRVFSIISNVTPSPDPQPSTTPQTQVEAPQGEQPQAGQKDEDKPEARNKDKKKKARPSPSPSVVPASSPAMTLTPQIYPIKTLGNCNGKEDCKKYCDIKTNIEKCLEYGVSAGLMSQAEVSAAEAITNISDGPGGCVDQESCVKVCDDSANTSVCLEYAKKNKLMTDDELEKAKKVAGIISSGSQTPGGCKTPETCKQYCTGGGHVDECIKFAKGIGLISGDEADKMEKGKDFLQNGGPGGCKGKEECEAYCDKDEHLQECEEFFKKTGVIDSKSGDKSGKPPKTGGGAVCNTQEECEAFCKNPANSEACKNVVMKGGKKTGPEITGDMGKMLEDISKMPEESRECLRKALGEETYEKLMKGEQPEKPISGDVKEACFTQGVEEYEEKAQPTKKPDDFNLEYGPGPSSQAIPGGVPEEIPPGYDVNPGGVPEVQGISTKASVFDIILRWFRK